MAMWESNTESGGSFVRSNTKNQGWAYSIGRLWSQVSAGSSSKAADGYQAEGSLFVPAKDSLIAFLDGSSSCSLNGFSISPLKKKLTAFLKFILLAWLVMASQFSLHAHGEQTDDLAIHSQLDRLHKMASQANFDAYFALYAPDAVFIGTDAGERWTLTNSRHTPNPTFQRAEGGLTGPLTATSWARAQCDGSMNCFGTKN